MATSPNYAWAEPDNSSLVKNGASDIRTLGDAIDTSVWNVGFGQAGKNKIINGDFKINQRGFSSNTTDSSYNFDRFFQQNSGGTFTSTPQTFTPATAPVTGYEGSTFLQVVTAGSSGAGDYGIIAQRVESVRTFAGQTVTLSFWAKAASGTPKIATEIAQNFGSGGSPSANVNTSGSAVTLSTSWARYSTTISVPSLSSKTIGTTNDGYIQVNLWVNAGSSFASRASSIGNQNATFQIWGVQLEYGSKATPFQTATGTLQGELAACQRYYWRVATGNTVPITNGSAQTATTIYSIINYPVTMRTTPTVDVSNSTNHFIFKAGNVDRYFPTLGIDLASSTSAALFSTGLTSSTTAGFAGWIYTASASAYFGLQAEL